MGTLYLVRHGQASFGAADYDCLSELGERQCRELGRYFAARGIEFEAVLVGTLRRHRQSLAALADGYGALPDGLPDGLPDVLPDALSWPGLNEYDADAIVQAVHPEPLPRAETPEQVRHHFRLLREGLARWMAGSTAPAGMPSHPEWRAGIVGALDHVRAKHANNVLIVSSGGPIATAVGHVLGTTAETTIELNLRLRNSALTEFAFTPKRHSLVAFNHLPHLDHAERRDWATYA